MLYKDPLWNATVTGPASRIPRHVDPEPTVTKLKARGLWDVADLDPRAQVLLERVVQDRMNLFPLHSDEHMPVVGSDLTATRTPGGTTPTATTLVDTIAEGSLGSVRSCTGTQFCSAQHGDQGLVGTIVRYEIHQIMGDHLAGPTALTAALHHEAFHPVVEALCSLPDFVPWLQGELAAADDKGRFSFDDPAVRDRIADQLGAYAGQPGCPASAPDLVVREMGAEALAAVRHLGRDAPPMAQVWWHAATALLGRGAPLAPELNQLLRDVHRGHWFQTRTGPTATSWLDRLPPGASEVLDADADFRWERAHPHDVGDDAVARQHDGLQRLASLRLRERIHRVLDDVREALISLHLPDQAVRCRPPGDPTALLARVQGTGEKRSEAVWLTTVWPLGEAHRDPLLGEAMHLEAEVLCLEPSAVDNAIARHAAARRLGGSQGPDHLARGTQRVAARRRTTLPTTAAGPGAAMSPGEPATAQQRTAQPTPTAGATAAAASEPPRSPPRRRSATRDRGPGTSI